MLDRHLRERKFHPIVAAIGGPILFIALSNYLFEEVSYAEYIYGVVALTVIMRLNEVKRNDFLQSCFSKTQYRQLRLVENEILSLPFVVYLIYQDYYILSVALVVLTGLLALTTFGIKGNFTIPTPFYKKPFEFAVGFRKTFWVLPLSYFILYLAVDAKNLNLGIFAQIVVFLVALSYYSKPEDKFYVWIFSTTPKGFLLDKMKTAIGYSTVMSAPITIVLCIAFWNDIDLVLEFMGVGYIFLITIIVAKYSSYPQEINVAQGVLLALCIGFPPLFLAIVPYWYVQSIKKIKKVLG